MKRALYKPIPGIKAFDASTTLHFSAKDDPEQQKILLYCNA